MQIVGQRLFEHVPLRLPVRFGNLNKFLVERGINLRSELLGPWLAWATSDPLSVYAHPLKSQVKSR